MFDTKSNTKQIILFNYIMSKDTYGIMPDSSLMRMIEELKMIEGLDEGVKLDYISHKISQGIALDAEEKNILLTTLALHGSDTFFDESMELVRVK